VVALAAPFVHNFVAVEPLWQFEPPTADEVVLGMLYIAFSQLVPWLISTTEKARQWSDSYVTAHESYCSEGKSVRRMTATTWHRRQAFLIASELPLDRTPR